MADLLAQAVRQQWEAEAQVRRLNDPFPLPVEWEAADADLVESWPHLRELARDWSGLSPANSTWAADPEGPAGKGGEIAQVFERIPTRRLVVLGEPGAGKSMLLIRLLLALLEHRSPGGLVPVLFSLASWNPARQDLYAWMADQLTQDHPALRAPADPPQPSPGTQARALLEWRLILPVLDGLDELPQAVRALALHAINQVLPAGQPLVLSSRTAEYRSALTPPAGVTVLLNGAAGIRLLPLDPAKAAAYLERDAGGIGTRAAARWSRVTASLGTGTPTSQALSTPLGLFLARTIYNPRPDEHPADLAHPDELLDQSRFPTREDIDTHLFAAFIPAAYRPPPPHPHHPNRWTAQQAQHTLIFLAHHLQHTLDGTPNLAWWQLPKALPKGGLALAGGLAAVLMGGLPFGIANGLGAGLAFGFAAGRPATGLTAGLTAGPTAMLMGGLNSVHPDLDKAVGPGAVLARDRRTFSVMTFAGGLMGVLAFGLVLAIDPLLGNPRANLPPTLAYGFAFGLTFGFVLGLVRSVWMEFLVAQIGLAVLGRVPWRFMGFLADAHERRGVLRQVGAVYQFRHLDLQRYLAERQP
ncbi:MAG: NACHT domain-containing protein [Streptomycetaceae bacterium]|nr:NACHT domain-containing protein [Streptomycetaceae bacterium]